MFQILQRVLSEFYLLPKGSFPAEWVDRRIINQETRKLFLKRLLEELEKN